MNAKYQVQPVSELLWEHNFWFNTTSQSQ